MSRLASRFAALREREQKALIPFVTAGDPDLDTTEEVLVAIANAGADAIEIGIPFSDPMAEGPTIQRASERALRAGTTLPRILDLVGRVRDRIEVPLILMGYANNVLVAGETQFAKMAAERGVDGLITVDIPPEEGDALFPALREQGVDPILLAAPTTKPTRLAMLARETRGFLYFVALTGVTGARQGLSTSLEAEVRSVRETSDVPVCVGFGVSTPEQAAAVARFADGVVVGSALIDRMQAAGHQRQARVDAAARFVEELKAPLG